MATDEIAKGVGVYSSIYCLAKGVAAAGAAVQVGNGANAMPNCNVDATLTASAIATDAAGANE